ncbi:hypothetical protein LEMLEM_LOCUS25087, partial [Lemmus lemmus]
MSSTYNGTNILQMAAKGQRSRVHTHSASCCPPDYLRQLLRPGMWQDSPLHKGPGRPSCDAVEVQSG